MARFTLTLSFVVTLASVSGCNSLVHWPDGHEQSSGGNSPWGGGYSDTGEIESYGPVTSEPYYRDVLGNGGSSSTKIEPYRPAEQPYSAEKPFGDTYAGGDYIVAKGDTLYSVASRHGVDVVDLARLNGLTAPYTIYPGDRLRLPGRGGASTSTTPLHQSRPEPARPLSSNIPYYDDRSNEYSDPDSSWVPAPTANNDPWRWPHSGRILRRFNASDKPPGIEIGGNFGDPITATRAGEIVYSGGGLARYGQLVIIKHDDEFLSAYAYNRRLVVSEGDQVAAGQKIAEMGDAPDGTSRLHFEIRRAGRAVNPSEFLPLR